MEQAWYVAVATAPPLIWLWAFLKLRGKESLAPGWTLLLSVGAGVLVTVPTAMLESILGEAGGDTWALTITGPVEETAKFVAVTAGVMDHRRMLPGILGGGDPERADRQLRRGVLAHTAAASMGFAIAENVGYVSAFGPEAMLLRGPVSTVHHLALGLVWGASLQAPRERGRDRPEHGPGCAVTRTGGNAAHRVEPMDPAVDLGRRNAAAPVAGVDRVAGEVQESDSGTGAGPEGRRAGDQRWADGERKCAR